MSMSVKEAIKTRHSIRKYRQEPVPREEIEEILNLVRLAPSAWNIQPWRFIVVSDRDKKKELYEVANKHPQVESAPVVIIMLSDMDECIHPDMPEVGRQWLKENVPKVFGAQTAEDRGQWGVAQSNIALGYLLIAIRSLGYDSSPMYGYDPEGVRKLFNLPDRILIPAIVTLGRGAEEGNPHHRHPLHRIVRYV